MGTATETVEQLTSFERRGPCTDAERRAAGRLHDDLRARGHEAWVETHWLRPQWAGSLAVHALLGVAASVAAVAYSPAGIGLALLAAVSLGLEVAGRPGLLRLAFPPRATQDVLTVPSGERPVTLLICARYDAPRAATSTGDRARRLAARLRRRLGGHGLSPRAWLVIALLVVAACAGARLAGAEGLAVGAVQFVPTVALLLAFAFAIDVAAAPLAPGANAGASGAAVALALYEELASDPPARLAPALLLFGAGDAGPLALRAHLRRERLRAQGAVLFELGPCGAGAPACTAGHQQLRAACAQVAAALGAPAAGGLTRTRTRLPGAALGCLDADGIAPREHVDPAALDAALDYALALVDALDAGLARVPPTPGTDRAMSM